MAVRTLVASGLISASVLLGSWYVGEALDRVSTRVFQTANALVEISNTLDQMGRTKEEAIWIRICRDQGTYIALNECD